MFDYAVTSTPACFTVTIHTNARLLPGLLVALAVQSEIAQRVAQQPVDHCGNCDRRIEPGTTCGDCCEEPHSLGYCPDCGNLPGETDACYCG